MKKIIPILLILMIVLSVNNVVQAAGIDNIMQGADNFLDKATEEGHTSFNFDGIMQTSDLIYNTLLVIGIIVAILVAAFLGIKFMVSSVEEQAKIKESLIPFVVGCIIIFGAFGIWKITTNIIENANNSTSIQP